MSKTKKVSKNCSSKKHWSKTIIKKDWEQKNLGATKVMVTDIVGPKINVVSKYSFAQTFFGPTNFWSNELFWPKRVLVRRYNAGKQMHFKEIKMFLKLNKECFLVIEHCKKGQTHHS